MASVLFDPIEFKGVIQEAVQEAVRQMDERRPRDEAGRVLLTKREAAEAMGVSEKTVDRWREEHGLPHIKLDNGKPMFRLESLKEWAEQHETSQANGG